jgi:pimeloyl-ACP methyl ester carboxylesterase
MIGVQNLSGSGVARLRLAARCMTLALSLSLLAAGALTAQSASPPEAPPAEWGPISINLEEIEYPFPVQYLERELFGEDVRIAYMDVAPVDEPNGRTVYLTHGASYYGWYWEETIRALANEGYRVIAEDRLGWGKSSKPLIPYSWHLHAENMKAVLDHLGIEQAAVIGHSMGGQMVTRFARLYPDVATHLILVNPIGLTGRNRPAPMEPVTRDDMPQVREASTPDRQAIYERHLRTETGRIVDWRPEHLEHVRIRFGNDISDGAPLLAAARSANQTGDSMVGDWPLIATRALVIGGAEDGANFPEAARNTAERLQNGEAYLIPDVGHNPHLEVPEILNREIIRFLGS